jgi:hypothetical protein
MKLNIKRSTDTDELTEYIEARKASDEAQARLKAAQKALIQKMTREQRKSFTSQDGGKQYKVTFVQNIRNVIDEPGLKKAMGAVAFRKVCKQSIDRKLLEEALEKGTADPMVVGQFVKEVPSEPFLKFTEGQASDDSGAAPTEQD